MAGATPRADMTSTLHLGFAARSVGDVSWRQASRTAVDSVAKGSKENWSRLMKAKRRGASLLATL